MWSIPVGTACTLRKKVYSLLSGLTVGYRQDLFYWLHYLSLPNFNSLLVHVLCYDWEKCMNISLQSVCLCYFIFSSCFCFSLMKILCSVQFSSVAQSCPTLCNPMNHSTPGLPVHHQLPEFTQSHVHRVGDAIQPSHPLSSPSRPAPNPSQHQSFPMSQLFTRGGQSTGVSASASFPPKISHWHNFIVKRNL